LYFDTAYVAKCYLNEPDARAVRELARSVSCLYTSGLTIAEVGCVFHRNLRERTLTPATARAVREQFFEDIENQTWILIPVSEALLRRVENLTRGLAPNVFIRAGDAIHLASAIDAGFHEVWSNDRHVLAAAPYFGIQGRQI